MFEQPDRPTYGLPTDPPSFVKPSTPPTFVKPDEFGARGTPIEEFATPPSAAQVAAIRGVLAVASVTLVMGVLVLLTTGDGVLLGPLFAPIVLWFLAGRWIDMSVRKKVWYALRHAVIGDRAKPPRLISERHANDLRARQVDDQLVSAMPGWVQAGMPTAGAPDHDYGGVPITATSPFPLTSQDIETICGVLRASTPMTSVGLVRHLGSRAERDAIERLCAAGVLRRTDASTPGRFSSKWLWAGNAELTPGWLPFLPVLLYPGRAQQIDWDDATGRHRTELLAVQGRVVQVSTEVVPAGAEADELLQGHADEELLVSARAGAGPDSRHCFRAMDPDAAVAVLQEIWASVRAAPGTVRVGDQDVAPSLTITQLSDPVEIWWLLAEGETALLRTGEGERRLDRGELAAWLRGLVTV